MTLLNINNLNSLIETNGKSTLTRNNNAQKYDSCDRNSSASSITALATFLTFSLIANIGLTVYIFRKNLKIFYENIIYSI